MSDQYKDELDYLMKSAQLTGAAVASVSDGHVLVLKKEKLRALLTTNTSEFITIFVQRLAPQNTN
jgi:hypothetical protein